MARKSRGGGAAPRNAPRSQPRKNGPSLPLTGKLTGRLGDLGRGALLLGATLLAYWPALNGGMILDDAGYVTRPELRSLHGLWRIWFVPGATPQYHPVVHSAFWLEHALWGDAMLGYHLVNVLLHVTAACLVVAIVRRLSLGGAWLAGFVFALHPVCVETVAWISGHKNTLSTVFYLCAALAYLSFDRTRRRSRYFLALGLFALALMSEPVAATLPAALLVVFWWRRGKLAWKRDALPLLPWFVIGAGSGLLASWVERRYMGAQGAQLALTLAQRCLLAGRAIWFYLGKLVWPLDLMFWYPRWRVDPSAWWQYLFPLGVLAGTAGLCWLARKNRGPLAAFLYFAGTLFPVLGFLSVYPLVYSWVADHFQYLASLGVIVPLCAAAPLLVARLPAGYRRLAPMAACALLAALGALAWGRSGAFRDADRLYADTLARNPGAYAAHINLGSDLMENPDRLPEAIAHFTAALRIKPEDPMAHYNLGRALFRMDRVPDAVSEFQTALRFSPGLAEAHNDLGQALATSGRFPEAIAEHQEAIRLAPGFAAAHNDLGTEFARIGRFPEATAEFEAALRINPDSAEARSNRGLALSKMGRFEEAAEELRTALRMAPGDAHAHFNLGYALAQIPGRLPDAVAEYRAAIAIDPAFKDAHSNLGRAFESLGRMPEAAAEYDAAKRLAEPPN